MKQAITEALAGGKNIVVLHANADADAAGSGITLAGTFENTILFAPEGLSRVGKKLMASVVLEPLAEANFEDYDNIVIVDAHSENMLGIEIPWEKAIVIDHHTQVGECNARLCFIDDSSSSTCELIWRLIGSPEKIDKKIGLALLTGIIADSGHFNHATTDTFVITAEILAASDSTIQEAMANFDMSEQDDMSQRISRLKGGQRLKYLRKGRWLVAMSQVGAFEANVARGLLGLGADVAFVASQEKENFRLTGRAKPDAVNSGLHLGKMLSAMSAEINGDGGGHECDEKSPCGQGTSPGGTLWNWGRSFSLRRRSGIG